MRGFYSGHYALQQVFRILHGVSVRVRIRFASRGAATVTLALGFGEFEQRSALDLSAEVLEQTPRCFPK